MWICPLPLKTTITYFINFRRDGPLRDNLANDVVPLSKEGYPIREHALLLVVEILPLWPDIFGLDARLGESSARIFTCEYYSSVNYGCQ